MSVQATQRIVGVGSPNGFFDVRPVDAAGIIEFLVTFILSPGAKGTPPINQTRLWCNDDSAKQSITSIERVSRRDLSKGRHLHCVRRARLLFEENCPRGCGALSPLSVGIIYTTGPEINNNRNTGPGRISDFDNGRVPHHNSV